MVRASAGSHSILTETFRPSPTLPFETTRKQIKPDYKTPPDRIQTDFSLSVRGRLTKAVINPCNNQESCGAPPSDQTILFLRNIN